MTREDYCAGRAAGEEIGAFDLSEELAVHHDVLFEAREASRGAGLSHGGRAYLLGWLRGYRDSVRTFERGRWGT